MRDDAPLQSSDGKFRRPDDGDEGWRAILINGGLREYECRCTPNVLKQSGTGAFPWCVKKGTAISDGVVEVKFKPISGKEDQAGGVI
jgi:hypothetical protein